MNPDQRHSRTNCSYLHLYYLYVLNSQNFTERRTVLLCGLFSISTFSILDMSLQPKQYQVRTLRSNFEAIHSWHSASMVLGSLTANHNWETVPKGGKSGKG